MPFAPEIYTFVNVGLGEGSMLPVGTPIPWPLATPPTGF
ncbi:phage tail protein, partial [Citrobacter braakii]|nr:phage tail protein [Citrobacter braakii]MEB0987823.1 phage tail protein [Citrobacter braakii]